MKKSIILASVIILSLKLSSQTYYYVSGKVIDAISKIPLQSASVFAQNTTIGTITDSQGNFKLHLPNGGYDLVITYTSYQTQARRISIIDSNITNASIELIRKEKELDPIVIASSNLVKDGWEIYGTFFLENFFGKTDNSKLCTLKNKDILRFYFSKKRNRLKILADQPLQFVNEALGYNIKYALDSFVYDYDRQITTYMGYPLFEEIQSSDSSQKKRWIANRLNAYNGSMLHFIRSLYNRQLTEEGFEIKTLKKESNIETYVPSLNFYEALNYSKDDTLQTVTVLPNLANVQVIYKKGAPEKTYLNANSQASSKFQFSLLSFQPNHAIVIEKNGYYYKQTSVIKSEYFAWKRMGDMLPYDFKLLPQP